jgi:hypothetical protein
VYSKLFLNTNAAAVDIDFCRKEYLHLVKPPLCITRAEDVGGINALGVFTINLKVIAF